jgi:hypothetical protein
MVGAAGAEDPFGDERQRVGRAESIEVVGSPSDRRRIEDLVASGSQCTPMPWLRPQGNTLLQDEGGEWAIQTGLGHPDLIAAALDRQRGADRVVNPALATTFAERVREEVVRAAAKTTG